MVKKCILICSNCHSELHNPNCFKESVQKQEAEYSHKTLLDGIYRKIISTGKCPTCDADVYSTKYCSNKCASVGNRKVIKRPSKETLKQEIEKMCENVGFSVIMSRYVQSGKWDIALDATNEKAKEILLLCRKV